MSQDNSIVVEPSIAEQLPAPVAKTEAPAPKLDEIKLPDDPTIPATYRGKSAKDLIEMHEKAASKIGQQGHELGVWRGLVGELTEKTRQAPPTEPKAAPKITSDALLSDPTSAISTVIRHELEEALKPIKQAQVTDQLESELAALNRDFPNFAQTGEDPEFQQWAKGKPGRAADAAAVARGDTSAARRLLEAWEDRKALAEGSGKKTTEESGKPQGVQGARAAATEAGGGGRVATTGKILNREEIVDMIINKPNVYNSDAFQAELLQAAKEGRIR